MNSAAENMPLISASTLRILIADDHDLVRHGLRSMLEAQPGWTICGEATTAREAIDFARREPAV